MEDISNKAHDDELNKAHDEIHKSPVKKVSVKDLKEIKNDDE